MLSASSIYTKFTSTISKNVIRKVVFFDNKLKRNSPHLIVTIGRIYDKDLPPANSRQAIGIVKVATGCANGLPLCSTVLVLW